MDRDSWMEKVFATAEKAGTPSSEAVQAKPEITKTLPQQESTTQTQPEKLEQPATQEKPKRKRGRPPKSAKKKEENNKS